MSHKKNISKFIGGVLLLLIWGYANPISAQKWVYDVDCLFYFDNREFHSPYSPSQTLMAMRLSPEIGILLADSVGGQHKLMFGTHYWQPLSNNFRDAKMMPTIYYDYRIKGFQLYFGSVPFTKMIEPFPELYLSDSLSYIYPNIQGALLHYASQVGYVEMQCDWRGWQSKTQREAFRLTVKGQFRHEWLYLGGIATLNHLANDADTAMREGVCDFALLNPFVGVNLSKNTPLDSLTFQTGFYYTLSRDRTMKNSMDACGLQVDIFLKWRFLGFKNNFYYGKNLFPFYEKYASLLYQGDPHYRSSLYNRTDFIFYFIQKEFVKACFAWRLLYVPGYKLENQQLITVQFNLNAKSLSRRSNLGVK